MYGVVSADWLAYCAALTIPFYQSTVHEICTVTIHKRTDMIQFEESTRL